MATGLTARRHLRVRCVSTRPTVTSLQSSSVGLYEVSVEDSHLLPHTFGADQTKNVRGGGAVRTISGNLYVTSTRFTRCSAGPRDGDFDSCALSFSASTSLCTDGLGGAISVERTDAWGELHWHSGRPSCRR
jgi:hypothetical protein